MRPIVRAGAGLVIMLVVAACGSSPATSSPTQSATQAPPPTTAPTAAPTTAATAAPTVAATCQDVTDSGAATTISADVALFAWTPSTIEAKVGDVITWTNADSAPHGLVTEDRSCRTASNMGRGQSRSLQFSVAGEYPFRCTVHPDMTGTLIITE